MPDKPIKFTLRDIGYICGDDHIFDHATALAAAKKVGEELSLYAHRKVSVEMWTNIVRKIIHLEDTGTRDMFELLNKLEPMLMSEREHEIMNEIKQKIML